MKPDLKRKQEVADLQGDLTDLFETGEYKVSSLFADEEAGNVVVGNEQATAYFNANKDSEPSLSQILIKGVGYYADEELESVAVPQHALNEIQAQFDDALAETNRKNLKR